MADNTAYLTAGFTSTRDRDTEPDSDDTAYLTAGFSPTELAAAGMATRNREVMNGCW